MLNEIIECMGNEIQFILYQLPDEEGKIQVVIKDETIWATQKAMAALFDVGVPDISKHLKKKFETGELDKNTTISKMETVHHYDQEKQQELADAVIAEPLPTKFNKFKKSNVEAFYYWNEIQKLI